jgi:hypothetical protein
VIVAFSSCLFPMEVRVLGLLSVFHYRYLSYKSTFSPDSASPVSSISKLTWRLKKSYHSQDGIKITIRKAKADPVSFLVYLTCY